MKQKNLIYNIIMLCICGYSIFITYQYKYNPKTIVASNQDKTLQIMEGMQETLDIEYLDNGALIRSDIKTLEEVNTGKLIAFDSLIGVNKLFIRIDQENCRSCIIDELMNIRHVYKDIEDANVIILANFDDPFNAIGLLNDYNLDLPLFNIKELNDNMKVENISTPYAFKLTKDRAVYNLHIPFASWEKKSINYYAAHLLTN